MTRWRVIIIFAFLLTVSGLTVLHSNAAPAAPDFTRFAAIGDFDANDQTRAVADLIAGWNPDFVITMGDNNYSNTGTVGAWDNAVGQYFGPFIHYPLSSTSIYSPGSALNRFFPALGNHDWDAGGYTSYFDLPGNERYYDFAQGSVHVFILDSDARELDGNLSTSTQAFWLKAQLAAAPEPWKIVVFHHPVYSSAAHGNSPWMEWPFQEWGASAVLNGHDHDYERIMRHGFPYIVNGFGGRSLYAFNAPQPGSVVRYNADYGAMLIEATPLTITFRAYAITGGGMLIDSFSLDHNQPIGDEVLVDSGSTWGYLDNGSDPGAAWIDRVFDDSAWSSGTAKLGYGGDGEITPIGFGPDPANKFITTYFRHTFMVTQPSRFASLNLEVLRDDGAAVYLNGAEVWRTNLPSSSIISTTLATTAVGGSDEQTFFSASIAASALISGVNIIAVEVHQAAVTSSDLGFDLRLTAGTRRIFLPFIAH
jgi:tartrate-resistant acid phosphatase type 5